MKEHEGIGKKRKTEGFFKDCITYVININRPFSVDGVKFVKNILIRYERKI